MKTSPAFQFYPADFINGTMFMSAEEVGAYIRLLCYQWQQGCIPEDASKLERIAGASVGNLGDVLGKFERCDDGLLKNRRMESYREELEKFTEEGVKGGQKSGAKRKGDSDWGRKMAEARKAKQATNNEGGNEALNEGAHEAGSEGLNERPTKPATNSQSQSQSRSHTQSQTHNTDLPSPPSSAVGGGTRKGSSSRSKEVEETPDARHRTICEQWSEAYRQHHGETYAFNGGRDGTALKRFLPLVKDITPEAFIARAKEAWARYKADRFATKCAQAATLHGLCTFWNDIAAQLKTPANAPPASGTRRPNNRDERGQRPGEIPTDVTADKIRRL